MKKLIWLLMVLLVTGCYAGLEKRIARLEKNSIMGLAEGAGANFYPFSALSGGGTGALDKLNGSSISLGDVAFVALNGDATYGNAIFIYIYKDNGGAVSEALPYIVKPDTNPNANYAWFLTSSATAPPSQITSGRAITVPEVRSGVIQVTAAGTYTLPKASTAGYGSMVCIIVRDTAETVVIEVDNADKIFLITAGAGAALDAGDTIDSPGNAGDYVCFVAVSDTDGSGTDGWWMLGFGQEDWTDGGAT